MSRAPALETIPCYLCGAAYSQPCVKCGVGCCADHGTWNPVPVCDHCSVPSDVERIADLLTLSNANLESDIAYRAADRIVELARQGDIAGANQLTKAALSEGK